jgi:uncharacterized protein YkuJ
MKTVRLNLLVMTLTMSVLGFSQKNGKEFFQHEKTGHSTTSKRTPAGWNDTKSIHKKWIDTKLQTIEGYKPLATPKKQTNAVAKSNNRHKAAKQQLDSVVYGYGEKNVYKYDAKGNNVVSINYYLDEEYGKYEYTYDSKRNIIMEIRYQMGVREFKSEYTYDAAGNRTMYAFYLWDGTDWEGLNKDSSAYDANGNLLLEISYVWDSGDWIEDHKREYKYDSDGNLTEEVTSYWYGTDWVEADKDEFVYNANGDILFEYSYEWSGTAWDTTSKTEAVYDIDGVLERMIHSDWNEYIAEWAIEKAEYTYDIDGYLEKITVSEWDESVADWMDYLKIQYAYDANKYQTMFAYYFWEDTDWVGIWKDSSAYDADGNRILRISYDWDNNGWVEDEKGEYAYDTYGNRILEASYIWDGTDWVGDEKEEYEYDANGNLLMEASYEWEEEEGDWFGSKYVYEYDMSYAKADLIFPSFYDDMYNKRLKVTFYWGTETDWTEEESEGSIYYWSEPKVGISEIKTDNVSVSVYPNPVSTQLHVNIGTPKTVDYAIYNIIGQIILQGKLQESSIINVESLSNGMYFLKIDGKTVKIVKE